VMKEMGTDIACFRFGGVHIIAQEAGCQLCVLSAQLRL
jgi:hypothetical protein